MDQLRSGLLAISLLERAHESIVGFINIRVALPRADEGNDSGIYVHRFYRHKADPVEASIVDGDFLSNGLEVGGLLRFDLDGEDIEIIVLRPDGRGHCKRKNDRQGANGSAEHKCLLT